MANLETFLQVRCGARARAGGAAGEPYYRVLKS